MIRPVIKRWIAFVAKEFGGDSDDSNDSEGQ